jgi:hypothetical protein
LSQIAWETPIDQDQLQIFVRNYFNMWTLAVIKHIVPTFLVRTLAQKLPDQRASNKGLDVHLVKQKKRQAAGSCLERKITYLPMEATTIGPVELDGEDWSRVKVKDGTTYHPSQRVECDVLECILRGGLPEDVFAGQDEPAASKITKKRAAKSNQASEEPLAKKLKLQVQGNSQPAKPQPQAQKIMSSEVSPQCRIASKADEGTSLDIFANSDFEGNGYDLLRTSCGRPPSDSDRNALLPISNLQGAPEKGRKMPKTQPCPIAAGFSTASSEAQTENYDSIGIPGMNCKQQEQARLARFEWKGEEMLSPLPLVEQSSGDRSARTAWGGHIEVIDLT